MKRTALFALTLISIVNVCFGYDYTDDIYYNPKKTTVKKTVNKNQISNYVDFSTVDIDEYNRRGQYYVSPIDTIGAYIESEPDFVYTTQIQKFYNPTIVVDNADILSEVINNSYGNIDIIYNFEGPTFSAWSPYYPSYYNWYNPWSWSLNWSPLSWSWSYYNPWYGWSAVWGPGWNWGWGPGWNWGPSWGWGPSFPPPGRPHNWAQYRPGGRQPFGPRPNHSMAQRPVGNFNGGHGMGVPPIPPASHGVSSRPGLGQAGAVSPSTPRPNQSSGASRPGFNGTPSMSRPAVGGNGVQTSRPGVTTPQPSGVNKSPGVNNARPGSVNTRPSSTTNSRPSVTTNSRPATTTTSRPTSTTKSNPSTLKPTSSSSKSTTQTSKSSTSTSRPSSPSTSRPSVSSGSGRGGFSSGGARGGMSGGSSMGGGSRGGSGRR